MASLNTTDIYLLNVSLELDQKNTFFFESETAQRNYFQNKVVRSYSNCTYQRKDSFIRVPDGFDELLNVNYVMYRNPDYSNKWFYAFIKDIEYKNSDATYIHIETDVLQTWHFNYNLKPSFVEREHVDNDTRGLHTVPEGLEMGEFICNNRIKGKRFSGVNIVVGTTIDLGNFDDPLIGSGKFANVEGGTLVNGIYSGIKYYSFTSITNLNATLKKVADAGQSDAIVSMFMADNSFFDTKEVEGKAYTEVAESSGAKTSTWSVFNTSGDHILPPEKPIKLDGYEPKNQKLLSFPFCYLMASNNNGANAIYKYEKFSSDECDFQFVGSLTPGMAIRLQPLNYDNQEVNNEEGLNVGKLPICAWNTDVYTNWLTQNSLNIALSVGSSALTMIGGMAMAGTGAGALMGGSAVVSGAMGIATSLGQVYQQSFTPPQAEGNINNGDVMYSSEGNRIDMYQMTIKKEYAQIIDEYFSMFGYKVNRVKIPNSNHRPNYWYTKTIDVNIDGAIPQKDLQKIKDYYNNGITFWKNPNNIQDYSVPNEI